jgi:hypothetical protein
MIKKRITVLLAAGTLAIMSLGGVAHAAQNTLGDPVEANCFGLRTSYHASMGSNGVNPARGNPAIRANDPFVPGDDFDSVADVQQHVRTNCG